MIPIGMLLTEYEEKTTVTYACNIPDYTNIKSLQTLPSIA